MSGSCSPGSPAVPHTADQVVRRTLEQWANEVGDDVVIDLSVDVYHLTALVGGPFPDNLLDGAVAWSADDGFYIWSAWDEPSIFMEEPPTYWQLDSPTTWFFGQELFIGNVIVKVRDKMRIYFEFNGTDWTYVPIPSFLSNYSSYVCRLYVNGNGPTLGGLTNLADMEREKPIVSGESIGRALSILEDEATPSAGETWWVAVPQVETITLPILQYATDLNMGFSAFNDESNGLASIAHKSTVVTATVVP